MSESSGQVRRYTSCSLWDRRKDGRGWYATFNYRAGGKRGKETHALKGAKTKRDANRMMNDKWAEVTSNDGTRVLGTDIPADVAGYSTRYVDDRVKADTLERSSARTYRYCAMYVKEAWGSKSIYDVTPDDVQQLQTYLADKGLAKSTRDGTMRFLHLIFSDMVGNGYLISNPIHGTRHHKLNDSDLRSPDYLDDETMSRLLEILDPRQGEAAVTGILVAAMAGLREGEVCGLQWRDVDFDSHRITVRRAIGREGGTTYVKAPKNSSSAAAVPMIPALEAALKKRRAAQMEKCLKAGISLKPTVYVTGQFDGGYESPYGLYMAWHKLAKKNNITATPSGKVASFHDLRHGVATRLLAAGIDIETVQRIMRHARASITLDVYGNATQAGLDRAESVMEGAFSTTPAKVMTLRNGTTGGE